jgi:hypothetical protein
MNESATAGGGERSSGAFAWLGRAASQAGAKRPRWLIEVAVLLLAGILLATATVNDVVRQVHVNHRLDADLRTWRAYTHHDYHSLSVSQDVHGLSTREVVCGNTSPGTPKERIQLCLQITGPVRDGRRTVSGGWYLPARAEDLARYRYACFGPAVSEERCPR